MDKNNGKRNNRKKKESEDILGMIRKRQEEKDEGYYANQQSKLRDFLKNLDKDTCEQDYSETPIYKLGYEDGETAGYEIASQKFQNELRSLRTMIDAMIDSK